MALAPGIRLGPYEIQAPLDYERARALIDESVTLLRPCGKWMLATALWNRSVVLLSQGQLALAVESGREAAACARETGDTRALSWSLSGLASVAAARGQLHRAARLWGSAESVSESIGAPLPPFVHRAADKHLRAARQTLGDERFAAAWTEGRQLTPDAAVAYALQDDESN